jgi:drug/metabolite transporter (DMT)-like permease
MKRTAYLLLVFTMLLWGGNAIAGKFAVGNISPMLLNTLRWLIAAVVLALLARKRLAAEWPVMKENAGLLISLGAAGMTGFGISLYMALTYTTAINVSIEQASMPLIVFVANYLFFRMPVTGGQILGFAISIIGVVITVTHGEFSRLGELDLNTGDAIMVLGVLFYGGYTAALRFRPALHWQTFMLAIVGSGFLTSLPFAIVEALMGHSMVPTTTGWIVLLYAGLFPSLISQVSYLRGVELIGANRAGLFINLVPIFGTLLSILLLGEQLQTYHAVALVMVLGGIYLAERRAPTGP